MHVVAVTPLYPPRSLVGSWLATHEFLAGLARRGDQVDVYRRLSGANEYVLDGVNVHPGRSNAKITAAIASADVVVSHLGDDGFAAYAAHKLGKPDVRLAHSHPHDALERLERCALAVFNSRSLADEVGWDGRQTVVHPPLRPCLAPPGALVTLVNLSQAKGGELFWRLTRKLPEQRFLGVRGWGLQLIFRRPNVTVLRPQLRMSKVFAQTRVLLMPSVAETWGMVGVEALACGIPVIAHPTPGLLESLGSGGIFADRDDEAAWLGALERLRDPAEWAAASTHARQRASELAAINPHERFAGALDALAPVAA